MKSKQWLPKLYLIIVLAIMYLPVIVVIVYSFNASKSDAVWGGFSLQWYGKMFSNTSLMEALRNSLIVAAISCLLSAVLGTLGAVGLVRSQMKQKNMISNLSMIPIMIPEIIMGMVFLAVFSFLGLPFGMITLIIAHISFCVPYIFLIVKGRLAGMDKSIEEAARDLGASPKRAFWDITLPMVMPAVLSGTLLAFAMSLDDVVISFFVTGPETNTLPIKIYSQIKVGVSPEINALCTVMLLVTFLIVILSGRITKTKKHKKTEENK
ncbi:MAG: ABC transporter permease [Massiliimalia sp.]|jgi:spermidine/putrescine transport system permease protein